MQIKRFMEYAMSLSIVVTSWIAIARGTDGYLNVSFKLITPITLHEPVLIDVFLENKMSYGLTRIIHEGHEIGSLFPEFSNKTAKPLLLTKYLGLKPIKTRINENEVIIADGP